MKFNKLGGQIKDDSNAGYENATEVLIDVILKVMKETGAKKVGDIITKIKLLKIKANN